MFFCLAVRSQDECTRFCLPTLPFGFKRGADFFFVGEFAIGAYGVDESTRAGAMIVGGELEVESESAGGEGAVGFKGFFDVGAGDFFFVFDEFFDDAAPDQKAAVALDIADIGVQSGGFFGFFAVFFVLDDHFFHLGVVEVTKGGKRHDAKEFFDARFTRAIPTVFAAFGDAFVKAPDVGDTASVGGGMFGEALGGIHGGFGGISVPCPEVVGFGDLEFFEAGFDGIAGLFACEVEVDFDIAHDIQTDLFGVGFSGGDGIFAVSGVAVDEDDLFAAAVFDELHGEADGAGIVGSCEEVVGGAFGGDNVLGAVGEVDFFLDGDGRADASCVGGGDIGDFVFGDFGAEDDGVSGTPSKDAYGLGFGLLEIVDPSVFFPAVVDLDGFVGDVAVVFPIDGDLVAFDTAFFVDFFDGVEDAFAVGDTDIGGSAREVEESFDVDKLVLFFGRPQKNLSLCRCGASLHDCFVSSRCIPLRG